NSDLIQRVLELNDRGFKFQSSIGASVIQREFIKEGETATVNGRSFAGPINVARKTVLGEVSVVVLGADDQRVPQLENVHAGAREAPEVEKLRLAVRAVVM
ncbi:hypothetical protein, partial [Klebsiella pneumoniae]|uniref:hypothetical protein n=1 Tax=Klebsiella pneumoniae TaxID=573 RepID=UPI003A858D88